MAIEHKLARGREEALEILSESSRAAQRLDDDYEQLKISYPDRWVAVSKDGLVAYHEDLAGIIVAFKGAGYSRNQVAVEFLYTEPRTLIL